MFSASIILTWFMYVSSSLYFQFLSVSNIGIFSFQDQSTLYDWDEKTQGLILSSFYWGYVLTHLPGGILAEKFGGKYSLGLGVLSTALFTLITPWVIIWTGGNWKALVALRIIEGFGEVSVKKLF